MKFDIIVEGTVTIITKDLEKNFRLVATHNSVDNHADYHIYPIVMGKHKELFVLNKCILMKHFYDMSLTEYIAVITELIDNSKVVTGTLNWNGVEAAAFSKSCPFGFEFGSSYMNSTYSGAISFDGIKGHDHIIICNNDTTHIVEDMVANLIIEA